MAAKQKVTTLAQLQTFLIQRDVVISGRKNVEFVELCKLAKEVALEFDAEGLFEERDKVVVTISTTETSIVVAKKSDGNILMEHSYTEVSACGRRTDYMNYFAYIAGDTTCNLAKNFQCHVFESVTADEAKIILCSIAQGFERTQWFL